MAGMRNIDWVEWIRFANIFIKADKFPENCQHFREYDDVVEWINFIASGEAG